MQRARRLGWVMGPGLALVLAFACRQSEHEVARTPAEPDPAIEPEVAQPLALAEPFMHAAATRFAPSLTAIGVGESAPNGARVADYDHCGSCHEEISMQWRTSAHSFASFNNPIYRASVDRFRERNGVEASRFCAGCHDPALLVDGSMDAEIATDEPRAHVGVGCLSCHGVESSTYDGNGSYVLAAREIPIPEMEDAASIERHRAAMGPAREQCGSCHRAFLGEGTGHPHHLNGTDEIGPHTDSSYTGNKLRLDTKVQEQDCADCHMPRQTVAMPGGEPNDPAIDPDGKLRSHRFIGGHSWLAAMRGDEQTLARVREFLQGLTQGKPELTCWSAALSAGSASVLIRPATGAFTWHTFPTPWPFPASSNRCASKATSWTWRWRATCPPSSMAPSTACTRTSSSPRSFRRTSSSTATA
jgi:hypothetical protein